MDAEENEDWYALNWKLSRREFSLDGLARAISKAFHIPLGQLNLLCANSKSETTKYRLPKGITIGFDDGDRKIP